VIGRWRNMTNAGSIRGLTVTDRSPMGCRDRAPRRRVGSAVAHNANLQVGLDKPPYPWDQDGQFVTHPRPLPGPSMTSPLNGQSPLAIDTPQTHVADKPRSPSPHHNFPNSLYRY
jgi:hypothetical protein